MTSPPVEEQLVPELELRKLGTERLHILPCRRRCRLTLPLDENLCDSARQPETHRTCWSWGNGAVVKNRQGRWSIWWLPLKLLEQPYVENIMKTGALRKSKADSDIIDQLDDAIGPEETRLELAGDRLWQGRSRACRSRRRAQSPT